MNRHQMPTQTRGRTQRVESIKFRGIFYENTFVLQALDAFAGWFWVNISPFGLSNNACKVNTESPVFYWYPSTGIRLAKIEAVPSSNTYIFTKNSYFLSIGEILNPIRFCEQPSGKELACWLLLSCHASLIQNILLPSHLCQGLSNIWHSRAYCCWIYERRYQDWKPWWGWHDPYW